MSNTIEGLTFGGEKWGEPITLPEVVSVRAVPVGLREKEKVQYLGLLADGTEVVLRKKGTYKPFAHYFKEAVASGVEGVPAHFSYSKSSTNPRKTFARIAVFEVAPP